MEQRLKVMEDRLAAAEREVRALRRRGRIGIALILTAPASGLVIADAKAPKDSNLFPPTPQIPLWLAEPAGKQQRIIGDSVGVLGSLKVDGSLTLRGPIRVVGSSGQSVLEIGATQGRGTLVLKDATGKVIFHAP